MIMRLESHFMLHQFIGADRRADFERAVRDAGKTLSRGAASCALRISLERLDALMAEDSLKAWKFCPKQGMTATHFMVSAASVAARASAWACSRLPKTRSISYRRRNMRYLRIRSGAVGSHIFLDADTKGFVMSSLLSAIAEHERVKHDAVPAELTAKMLNALHVAIFGSDLADAGSHRVFDALDALTPRERDILVRRYGLQESKALLKQRFAVTEERIRQIERQAIEKCRRAASGDDEKSEMPPGTGQGGAGGQSHD